MKAKVASEIAEVIGSHHYLPAVSIIMPFEPKMSLKNELNYSLKMAEHKVKKALDEACPGEMATLVLQKLKAIIQHLNFSTHKKSIAIYVSPVFEKVLYLDITVVEKIIIDESFEIRDLIYCKKEPHQYLILKLSPRKSSLFIGDPNKLSRIVSNTNDTVFYLNKIPGNANYPTQPEPNELLVDKFLHEVDIGLGFILNAYHLPLFVLGTRRMIRQFKNISKHGTSVIAYLPVNYQITTPTEIKEILKPFISDWKKIRQKDLMNQLQEANSLDKLAIGIQDVRLEASHRKGRLLLVEKNHLSVAQHGASDDIGDDIIYKASKTYNKFSCIKDAVDEIIEKVLENGGDVEFVDDEILKPYGHIALIQYY